MLTVLSTALIIISSLFAGVLPHSEVASTFHSVEVGYTELSPRGESGGYAVPASGSSGSVPYVLLESKKNSGNWINRNSRNMVDGDSFRLKWYNHSGVDEATCEAVGFNKDNGNRNAGTNIAEPPAGETWRYEINCDTASDFIEITNRSEPPADPSDPGGSDTPASALLEVRKIGDSTWQSGNINIQFGEEVELRWGATNAVSCGKSLGPSDFNVSGTSGTDNTVTEPTSGSASFQVACVNGVGNSSNSNTIVVSATGGTPTLEASDNIVHAGDSIRLDWNTRGNDPATCSISGENGFSLSPLPTPTGDTSSITIEAATTFTLTCAGGSVEETVNIIPVIFES